MRRHLVVHFLPLFAGLVLLLAGNLSATDFTQLDGTVIKGSVAAMGPEGVSFKTEDGKYTPRIKWEKFTQETLREFSKDPKAAKFVELLVATADTIDEDKMEAKVRPPKPPVSINVRKSPGRPNAGVGIMAALTSGVGLLVFGVLYAANLYSGYSVAFFRRRPWWMVLAVCAVAPVVGQTLFLILPPGGGQAAAEAPPAEAAPAAEAGQATPHEQAQANYGVPGQPVYGGAAPVEVAPAVVAIPATQVYRRGEFNLNRRFIESKFSGFFRVIPSEADRDLLLIIKSARGEFISRHIVRATNTDIVFQVPRDSGGTVDETVPLNDLFEIQVRHKDAPPQ